MKLEAMIEAAVTTFKQTLWQECKDFDTETLTPALCEQVTGSLRQALSAAGVCALRTFLQGYESEASSILVEERLYRLKQASAKTFLTPFGAMELDRNLYQSDAGGLALSRWMKSGG